MLGRYNALADKTLVPTQAEALLLATMAYEIMLHRIAADDAIAQNLSAFSSAPMLDYLAENKGVFRLAATPAETTLVFNLSPGHASVTLPAGTRVRTTDGLVQFATDEEKTAAPGTDVITVGATALTDGPQGNAYAVGTVTDVIDDQPFLVSATNSTVTGGGADIETDEGLRARIKTSENQFSTAGSKASYKFWALSANPSIIDAAVVQTDPGEISIYPLVKGGIVTPQAVLDAVADAVSGDEHEPHNDTVFVLSPTRVEFELPIQLVLKYGAVQSVTEQRVYDALSVFFNNLSEKLGADVTDSQVIAAGMNEWVYDINLPGFSNIIIDPTEFPVCTQFNKSATTYENPDA